MSLQAMQELENRPGDARAESPREIVSVDSLRSFPELVKKLCGEPAALLRRARIDPAIFCSHGAVLEYRSLLQLLELAAEELSCPDFGLRLAVIQGGNKAIGPIGIVMKNSKTLGQAIGYCAKHIHAYSVATRVRFQPDRANHKLLLRLEILLHNMVDKRQGTEHAFMLANLNIIELTGGAARARKILFAHEPIAKLSSYRDYFGCDVRFGQDCDGMILTEDDLLCEVVDPDARVFEMATSFIDSNYPHSEPPIQARVRCLIAQYLGTDDCTNERIAAELCLHPRTLQRRLRAVGCSFEDIKDDVRRDVALRCIQQDIPLTRVAEKLGYAETSVLTRSCFRWFSASPRQIRLRTKLGGTELWDAKLPTAPSLSGAIKP